MAKRKSAEEETVVVRHVREWRPHAQETLPQIEQTIDSWGGGVLSVTERRPLPDASEIQAKVDQITRRVKGRHKVTVRETVTEWVEGPPGSGPIDVEDAGEAPPLFSPPVEDDELPSAQVGPLRHDSKRPRRRFSLFRRRKEAEPEKTAPVSSPELQPQCSALTADGAQCRNSARHGSQYCISHKGWQPATAKGLAQRIEGDAWDPNDRLTDRQSVATADTLPRVKGAKDTKVKVRKAARKGRGR
jgi:hypothetical protein